MDGHKLTHWSTFRLTAVLLAITTLLSAIPPAHAVCDEYNVGSCFTIPIHGFATFFNITLEQFGVISGKANNLPECIEKMECSKADSYGKYAFALADGFGYLSHDGSLVFRNTITCLASVDAQRALSGCNATYYAVALNGSMAICSAFPKLLECYRDGVSAFCGADIKNVFVTYYKKVAPAYSAHIKCNFGESYDWSGATRQEMHASLMLLVSTFLCVLLSLDKR